MRLKLTRPLAFIDLEATGIDVQTDRIVEISICTLNLDGTTLTRTRRVNPEIPIPPGATEVHHITDDDVRDMPTFRQIAKGLLATIAGCDLAGFNSNRFDFPMLNAEFFRAGITWEYWNHRMVDVGNIFKIKEPRTLEAAVEYYLNRAHDGAHGAEADTVATMQVLLAQLDKYPDLPADIADLAIASNYDRPILDLSGKFTVAEDGVVIFNFGPHKGESARDHIDFVDWMMSKDFPPDTKRVCLDLLRDAREDDGPF